MTIAEVAKRYGITPDTLRYYADHKEEKYLATPEEAHTNRTPAQK